MITTNSDIEKLKLDGFVLKKNILNINQVEKIKDIIKLNSEGKGAPESHYPLNMKSFMFKLIKLDYKKINFSLYLLDLKKKLNLDLTAKNFFKRESKLVMLDGYYNKSQEADILPWHSDQAYAGAKSISKIASPNFFFLKFFFFLTDVGSNNGCFSYIPGSHKITHVVRSCLYEKKIKYEPFWEISDLVNIITKKKNYTHIAEQLDSKIDINNFLENANLITTNKNTSLFDFNASPGDLFIFDESGLHKGSKPSSNERIVLRYTYSTKVN